VLFIGSQFSNLYTAVECGAVSGRCLVAAAADDDDVFHLFLQKQKRGAELHIYLEEGTYHNNPACRPDVKLTKDKGTGCSYLDRWLKAWPLLLLLDFKATDSCNLRWRFKSHSIRLGRCWQALGLPSEASDWDHKRTLRFLRVQQQKAAAGCIRG
jgi:hypothetical protein